jgi:hypothetical protein
MMPGFISTCAQSARAASRSVSEFGPAPFNGLDVNVVRELLRRVAEVQESLRLAIDDATAQRVENGLELTERVT